MVCAVDCGVAVNPNVIEAQMQGGIGFWLTAALRQNHPQPRTAGGGAKQLRRLPAIAYREMPKIEVHIVPSEAHPPGWANRVCRRLRQR